MACLQPGKEDAREEIGESTVMHCVDALTVVLFGTLSLLLAFAQSAAPV